MGQCWAVWIGAIMAAWDCSMITRLLNYVIHVERFGIKLYTVCDDGAT